MNITRAYCRFHGETAFGRMPRKHNIECLICGNPPSFEDEAIHIKEVKHRERKLRSEASGTEGAARAVVPSTESGMLFEEER